MIEENNTSNNNINNNIYGQVVEMKYPRQKNNELYKEQFEQFYKQYPKKVKKQEVLKWFDKNKPSNELFSSMMSSLEQFKKSQEWLKDGGQYIPYPTTWLNQKRWEDETICTTNTFSGKQEIIYNTDFSEYDEYAKSRKQKTC